MARTLSTKEYLIWAQNSDEKELLKNLILFADQSMRLPRCNQLIFEFFYIYTEKTYIGLQWRIFKPFSPYGRPQGKCKKVHFCAIWVLHSIPLHFKNIRSLWASIIFLYMGWICNSQFLSGSLPFTSIFHPNTSHHTSYDKSSRYIQLIYILLLSGSHSSNSSQSIASLLQPLPRHYIPASCQIQPNKYFSVSPSTLLVPSTFQK